MEEKRQTHTRIEAIFRKRLVESGKVFVAKSRELIFSRMDSERGDHYFKEILHSIFFICYIYKQRIDPAEILDETLVELSEKYPDVFESYKSQLPRRTPFSILLEVVVETSRDRSETVILQQLRQLNDVMVIRINGDKPSGNNFCFSAAVVSYSNFQGSGQTTRNYFGASISCKGPITTMIFISVACIETWNDNVAHAVCLAAKHNRSITWPDGVYSTAYRLRSPREGGNYSEIKDQSRPPCLKCQKIFPNVTFLPPPTTDQNTENWQYGNCAECEAISNLLNGETWVSEETQQLNAGLEPTLMTLREEQEGQLQENLKECNFNINPEARFYNP